MNYKEIVKRKEELKQQILKVFPSCPNTSGIYVLTRTEVNEKNEIIKKVAYVGQSIHILDRLAEHLQGWQWIDMSLKKWGLYSKDNRKGYMIAVKQCSKEMLDELERKAISCYQENGYELRNQTTGGQDNGKQKLGEWKAPKTYQDGIKQGYKNCQKYVKTMFDKYLKVAPKDYTKMSAKKFIEFDNFLKEN